MAPKTRSIVLLLIAEVAAMSLWFVSAAILPGIVQEFDISNGAQAALSSSVQAGFVVGALISAILGLPDRFDARRLFAVCAILAGAANLALLATQPGSPLSIVLRAATGALLAGVYPVGMKIIAGWGLRDRGFLVGALVGALTIGTAIPHLFALLGGADWRFIISTASLAALLGGLLVLITRPGPHESRGQKFDPAALALAWREPRIRFAYLGYLGHMWELYAMWAWIGVIATAAFGARLGGQESANLATAMAFITIAIGGVASVVAGRYADRVGKAEVAIAAMTVSGLAALATALSFSGPIWLTIVLFVIWGAAIIPDSAQFSALVADHAPADKAGSLLTLQTALGFALTFLTVQVAPILADIVGWSGVITIMALGPAFGIFAMRRLRALSQQTS